MPATAWEPLGRSLENRVIEFGQFGSGSRHVLVVGPLTGDSLHQLAVIDRLAAHLVRFPRSLTDTTVTIVRDPNPDGRAHRTAGNARGVHLDANFHTTRWRKIPEGNRWLSGREPESEPETRILVDLLADLKPDRIVIVAGAPRQAGLAFCGPAEAIARQVGIEARLRTGSIDPSAASGSLASYAGTERGIPTLVLQLAAAGPPDAMWAACKRALLCTIGVAESDASVAESGAPGPPPVKHPVAEKQKPRGRAALLPAGHRVDDETPGHASGQADASQQPSGQPSPPILSFENFHSQGATVPVISPRSARQAWPEKPAAPQAQREQGAGGKLPKLQRLPPVDVFRPAPHRRDVGLPQEPIPVYPETGL